MIETTLDTPFCIALAATASLDILAVYARDLMMLQQNSYRNERYNRWFSQSGESTNIGRIFCCIALLMLLVKALPLLVSASAGIIITLWQAIRLFRAKYKKPLVWTPRAKRIYGVMLALSIVIAVLCGIFAGMKGACRSRDILLCRPHCRHRA